MRSAPPPAMRARGTQPAGLGRGGSYGSPELAHVSEVAGDGGGGGHRRAHQVCLSVLALAAFEISVRGRSDPLAVHRSVVVHRHAVRAAGLAPFEPGFEKESIEPLFFGLV